MSNLTCAQCERELPVSSFWYVRGEWGVCRACRLLQASERLAFGEAEIIRKYYYEMRVKR